MYLIRLMEVIHSVFPLILVRFGYRQISKGEYYLAIETCIQSHKSRAQVTKVSCRAKQY